METFNQINGIGIVLMWILEIDWYV